MNCDSLRPRSPLRNCIEPSPSRPKLQRRLSVSELSNMTLDEFAAHAPQCKPLPRACKARGPIPRRHDVEAPLAMELMKHRLAQQFITLEPPHRLEANRPLVWKELSDHDYKLQGIIDMLAHGESIVVLTHHHVCRLLYFTDSDENLMLRLLQIYRIFVSANGPKQLVALTPMARDELEGQLQARGVGYACAYLRQSRFNKRYGLQNYDTEAQAFASLSDADAVRRLLVRAEKKEAMQLLC